MKETLTKIEKDEFKVLLKSLAKVFINRGLENS
jgi:hypothetical protein